ncbi:replication restart helicase PriA [Youxingia wuxianensis]|uniref:Replication restart protein PriA n=1 Tax=Youxingia wuxianensis TaxID=2763678 RepID=A0A926IHW2_9FIRM|nr:primosomal protein N' [Youxingia wuxianensis]MBC8585721.1 primosomal protein N' [Youxingia wuxianensis]
MVKAAKVVVENATLRFDKPYTYLVPQNLQAKLKAGCRVVVPFGAGNRPRFGLVMEISDITSSDRLKEVASIVDEEPLLSEEMLYLVNYLHETTFCSYFDGVRCLLPPGIGVAMTYTLELAGQTDPTLFSGEQLQIIEYLQGRGKPVKEQTLLNALQISPDAPALRSLVSKGTVIRSQEVKRRILDEKMVMVRLTQDIYELSDIAVKITPKQKAVVELLLQVGQASVKEVCYFAAVGKTVVDRLEANGVVRYFTREVYRNPYEGTYATEDVKNIHLSQQQQTAYEELCRLADEEKANAALLYGVTGSGKTEVFLQVIDHVLQGGRGVIVMVPEISLTPQTIERFHRYFGKRVAVLHSALSMSERMDEWKRIKNGDADIVVGTRSAVFAPLSDIGLIIMDEEQESTYKSEKSPRFHARDVARVRAAYHKGLLLLASATPSVESFYRAKQGKYHLLSLKERYGTASLPDVYILDMAAQQMDARCACLSGELIRQLRENLDRGEQSILLLNRRGYNTLVKCSVCGKVAECPHCSVALTYHSANSHLMCHYCGYTAPIDAKCPVCGSKFLRFSGAGTQKVEQELEELFPDARVLRMDMDTTMSRFSHEKYFSDFSAGKYDIIIGTQMVAKGLDFPNVTLVGVLSADASLYAQDYRSFERAFSLFTQVVGRSGRAEKAGRAYIQTFTPENPVIALAAAQDYEGFYQEEIESRKIHLYPPFCDMVGIGFSGGNLSQVQRAAKGFLDQLAVTAANEYPSLPLRVLGPCESQILKIAGKFRYRMAIKCSYNSTTRELLWKAADWYYAQNEFKGVGLSVEPRYENSI